MTSEQNKTVMRRYRATIDEAWPSGNWARLAAYYAPDFTYHEASAPLHGRDAFLPLLDVVRAAFPDYQVTDEDNIAEGDKVLIRYTATATHHGDWLAIAPTGKTVRIPALRLYRLQDGKITEARERLDMLHVLQQLGAKLIPSETVGAE